MDGDLRRLFRQHLPAFQWTAIESGATSSGIPDAEYCAPCGTAGWLEYKGTMNWKPVVRPLQVSWHLRRHRMGGRSYFAVRRQSVGGPRSGPQADELWLIKGGAAARLKAEGLKGLQRSDLVGLWIGGPGKWFWEAVGLLLTR